MHRKLNAFTVLIVRTDVNHRLERFKLFIADSGRPVPYVHCIMWVDHGVFELWKWKRRYLHMFKNSHQQARVPFLIRLVCLKAACGVSCMTTSCIPIISSEIRL